MLYIVYKKYIRSTVPFIISTNSSRVWPYPSGEIGRAHEKNVQESRLYPFCTEVFLRSKTSHQ